MKKHQHQSTKTLGRKSMKHQKELIPVEQKLCLTIQEAAQLISCSTITVRRLIKEGKLQIVRVGRDPRVKTNSLHSFLESNTVQAVA